MHWLISEILLYVSVAKCANFFPWVIYAIRNSRVHSNIKAIVSILIIVHVYAILAF